MRRGGWRRGKIPYHLGWSSAMRKQATGSWWGSVPGRGLWDQRGWRGVSEGKRAGDEARNQQEQTEGAGEPPQAWEQQPNLTCPVLVSELGASHPTSRLNLWQFFKAGFQTHFKGSRGQEREGTCPRSHSSEALSPSELVAGKSGEDCALSLLVFLQPLLSASAHKSL